MHSAARRTGRRLVCTGNPAVADGKVYFGCDDYRVYALDIATGEKIWSFDTGDAISASPVVANGLVFIGSWDNHFYTLW